ncbi:adenylate kinase, chloroplastic-like [Hibiscus syriacus]|uniref:adenylate kinase, chloroplastic-like n=1 Tax=Hibiscus syriacus TaxID=106335 RepID=UPI001923EB00|nr:adenylate kinase, chloroplastic-like [Hibiscus syriacus]
MLTMGSSTCLSPCISLSPSLSPHPKFPNLNPNPLLLSHPSFAPISLRSNQTPSRSKKLLSPNATNCFVAASAKGEPLKVIISGAPASGKGTQCELITRKYGLVHISAGDLLRAEIAAASENGKLAKEYMEKGQLVPNEIVVMMVKERLLQLDSQQRGWLLDGYPRSSSQAAALEDYGIRPDVFILLDVSEDILVERVVGRRLDPLTGKIYHLKYSPPKNVEIASRLTQRFDDTEEKVKLRLRTHDENVDDVLSVYKDITVKVNGNMAKENVFEQIDAALTHVAEQRKVNSGSLAA